MVTNRQYCRAPLVAPQSSLPFYQLGGSCEANFAFLARQGAIKCFSRASLALKSNHSITMILD